VQWERSRPLFNSSGLKVIILNKKLEYSEGVGYLRVAADSLVSPEPCFLFSVCLAANSSGVSTAVIRNGHNTDADIVIDLACLASTVNDRNFDPPLLFTKGLYVDVGANVTSVLVRYSTRSKEK